MTMKYEKLEGSQCWVRLPGNRLETFAAKEARQNKEGLIKLIFEDGSEETAPCPGKDLHDFSSWFEVVSFVNDYVNNAARYP